jgi:hypothetical protein
MGKSAAGEKGDRHLLCDDHASMVPAFGPFRQKLPVSLSRLLLSSGRVF